MKPRLGRRVYCIYHDGILGDKVAFVGRESFIIESFGPDTNEDSWAWNYDDYGKTWFTNLSKARDQLLANYKEKYGDYIKVVKIRDNWYQLEEQE